MKIRVRSRTSSPSAHLDLVPMRLRLRPRARKILDFDCECRPLNWISADYVGRQITAIAWAWTHEPEKVTCLLLGEETLSQMLQTFTEVYNEADMVTGHFIRGFDLPLINGMLMEEQLPILSDKLSHDTKLDLRPRSGISGSQENIGARLGLVHPKVHMNEARWRSANKLEPEGLAFVKERAVGDVAQHIEMRQKLLDLGYLGAPRIWRSTPTIFKTPEYTP